MALRNMVSWLQGKYSLGQMEPSKQGGVFMRRCSYEEGRVQLNNLIKALKHSCLL